MLKIICGAKTKFNTSQYILYLNCEVNLHKHFLDISRTIDSSLNIFSQVAFMQKSPFNFSEYVDIVLSLYYSLTYISVIST